MNQIILPLHGRGPGLLPVPANIHGVLNGTRFWVQQLYSCSEGKLSKWQFGKRPESPRIDALTKLN